MWLRAKLARQPDPHGFHLVGGKRDRRSAKTHQARYARNFQDAQAVAQRQVHEHVTREERHLQLHSPVIPSPHAAVQRQKVFHGTRVKLFGHAFFMVRKRGRRIPPWLKSIVRQIQILPATQHAHRCVHCRARHLGSPLRLPAHLSTYPTNKDQIQLRPVTHRAMYSLTLYLSVVYKETDLVIRSPANRLFSATLAQSCWRFQMSPSGSAMPLAPSPARRQRPLAQTFFAGRARPSLSSAPLRAPKPTQM